MSRRNGLIAVISVLAVCLCLTCVAAIGLGGFALLLPNESAPVSKEQSTAPSAPGAILTPGPIPDLPLALQTLASPTYQSVDDAEKKVTDWMRETSGVREVLGPRADQFFQEVDSARARAMDAILTKARVKSKLPGRPLPITQGAAIGTVAGFLAFSPDLFSHFSTPSGENRTIPPLEFSDNSTEGQSIQMRLQPHVEGASLAADVDVSIRIEKDGLVYEESGSGTVKMSLCPDAQGAVPVEFGLKGAVRATGGEKDKGTQFSFQTHVVGNVNDDAQLSDIEVESRKEMSKQDPSAKSQGANQYVEWTNGYRISGFEKGDLKKVTSSGRHAETTRASSQATTAFAQESVDNLFVVEFVMAYLILDSAEKKWLDGFCVEVVVPEMGGNAEKLVPPNSDTPFTGVVRHKFEGKELQVPVMATLTSGNVAVTPSGTKVTAPAKFNYKAPNELWKTAAVDLTTRSRRGIGKLNVSFITSARSYILEIDSKIKWDLQGAMTSSSHIQATIPLVLYDANGFYEGEGDYKYLQMDYKTAACSTSTNPGGGKLHVTQGVIPSTLPEKGSDAVQLYVDTYEPDSKVTISCPRVGTWTTNAYLWGLGFNNIHLAMKDRMIANWNASKVASVLAEKLFKREATVQGAIISEETTLYLKEEAP